MTVCLTHVGGPTLLLEAHGWRVLSDPTFDPPGRRYSFGWGTSSTKTTGPALAVHDLPPLSRPIAGEVVGFALRWDGDPAVLWVSGDTVLHDGVREVAERLEVDVAVLHLGAVRFPVTGRLRYSMSGADAIALVGLLRPRVAVPVHFEGWSHFSEQEHPLRSVLGAAPDDVRARVRWLSAGVPTDV